MSHVPVRAYGNTSSRNRGMPLRLRFAKAAKWIYTATGHVALTPQAKGKKPFSIKYVKSAVEYF